MFPRLSSNVHPLAFTFLPCYYPFLDISRSLFYLFLSFSIFCHLFLWFIGAIWSLVHPGSLKGQGANPCWTLSWANRSRPSMERWTRWIHGEVPVGFGWGCSHYVLSYLFFVICVLLCFTMHFQRNQINQIVFIAVSKSCYILPNRSTSIHYIAINTSYVSQILFKGCRPCRRPRKRKTGNGVSWLRSSVLWIVSLDALYIHYIYICIK